jgi:hypothetical protein
MVTIPLEDVRKMKRSASSHSIESKGEHGGEDFQIQAVDPSSGRQISLWHDVSLVHIDPQTQQPTPYLNFVCEIPKFTRYEEHRQYTSVESDCSKLWMMRFVLLGLRHLSRRLQEKV